MPSVSTPGRPDDDEVDRRVAAARTALLTTLDAEIASTSPLDRSARWGRSRRRTTVVVAGVSALALTAGAWAVQRASQEEIDYSVNCYEGTTTDSRLAGAGTAEAVDANGQSAERDLVDPLAMCSSVWRWGVLGQAAPPEDPNAANFPVPPLTACTAANGVNNVFVRDDEDPEQQCASQSMTPWAGS
ncbi:hypothetical protein SAMN06264364_105171 [Quadrisphaera granulorum]|uniref:Uncharacterized protein n=1 Tax=Quadrisphaera granulorum TaxID=317664 RepID=A0A316ABK5_9ACTN|nr:hypothetical protein [Quadrisphaera granulorum]PWJ54962.1 hypothetical protein BXY45_105171 [Quadrisphaera granulorum]SZE95908.1 hypothetical protein SAMN06264364_105171 [Quadrisphaera granulorum]